MRDDTGEWRRITYSQMLERVRRVAQALAERELSENHTVVILSDNDLEHLTMMLACQWVGVPSTSVSTAYSLVSQDFGKLRHILSVVNPGLIYAADASYAHAIDTTVAPHVEVILGRGTLERRAISGFDALLQANPGVKEEDQHRKVTADTIAKFLFTSGSTQMPKGVINTQRMLCSNLQMVLQCHPFLAENPPVLVDWLPWSHTFGGNHNVGLVIYNGGTLFIDEGRPTAPRMAATLRNLREISPTMYYNVPKGFEELVIAMDHDTTLRDSLFRHLKVLKFAGAGLSQSVWDRLDAHAEAAIGERVYMSTGLGMTETAPSSTCVVGPELRSGHIGLPCPGVSAKLIAVDGKIEIRFKGPNVTPGYWGQPEQTNAAFDEEGFYRTGDAVQLVDPADLQKGLKFDGRIAEDFKLSTGTFVSVGPLRAKIIAKGAPYVQDAVITGLNRDEVGMLVIPSEHACRELAGAPAGAPLSVITAHPAVADFFRMFTQKMRDEGTGSSNRVTRAIVLTDPPSLDKGEVTDKGSINQRAVLTNRSALVEALYAPDGDRPTAVIRTKEVA